MGRLPLAPNTHHKSPEGPENQAEVPRKPSSPGNAQESCGSQGTGAPNKPGFHSQPGQAWGSPSRAPPLLNTQDQEESVGETARGRHRSRGRPGAIGPVEVDSGGQVCPFQTGRKHSWAATLWLSEAGCAPIATLPASPFPVSPPLGWHHLKSSSPAGGQGRQLPQWKEHGAGTGVT